MLVPFGIKNVQASSHRFRRKPHRQDEGIVVRDDFCSSLIDKPGVVSTAVMSMVDTHAHATAGPPETGRR